MSSLLRSKIIDILNASVGQYCHGIDKDHISVSVFNGEVRISDVAIKQDCFIHHGLPFSVSSGRIGSLVVLIPWASLSSQPIDILMTDLVLDVCDSDLDANGDICRNLDERALRAKEANLASDTVKRSALLNAQGSSAANSSAADLGRIRTLVAGAVKNLNCSLTNLTIRYTSRDGSYFVFHIDSVALNNVDAELKRAFLPVHAVTRKCCQVESLSITACAASGIDTQVLEPLSSKLILSFENGADARLLVGSLSVNVDSALVPVLVGITANGRLRIAQSRCASSRPGAPVSGNTRLWWSYVLACVRAMVTPHARKMKPITRKISLLLKEYCGMYIKVLLGDEDVHLLNRLGAIESGLHSDLIFRFRDRCVAIILSRGVMARNSQAASAARGGWFSKLLGTSPNQPLLMEEELQALSELSIAPDLHVLQHDSTQPAVANDSHFGYKASVDVEAFSVRFWESGSPSFSAAVSKFSSGISYSDDTLQASCSLHRLMVTQHSSSHPNLCVARSSLLDADAADQLFVSVTASPASTSISGKVSGADIVINSQSLSLLSHWLDKARLISTHSTRELHAHAGPSSSSVSLKLVAMHIQHSPHIEVDISWQAPTIKLQLESGTLCLVLGRFTLTSVAADAHAAALVVDPPPLLSSSPHFFSGAFPCPSAIYHRFQLSLADFTLGLSDMRNDSCQPHHGLQSIIAPTTAQLSFAIVRGEFMGQSWPLSQANTHCDTLSLEISPCYCSALNEAILMFIKLLSAPTTSHSSIIDHDVLLSISSYSGRDDDETANNSPNPALLLFVSNVTNASVRIVGLDLSRSDCTFNFSNSRTSLILRSLDTEAYMSVMQVTCCNNLLPVTSPAYTILSVNPGAFDNGSLLHFWYAEKGSSLWSDKTVIGSKRISCTGPSLGLSLDCADAQFSVDLFCSQGLLALVSDNLDAFSASVKNDLSRKVESLMTEVKQQMSSSGSTFVLLGKFRKLSTALFSGSERVAVLSAELSRSSVELLFSEGSLHFNVSSDAFKAMDRITSESKTQHVVVESDASESFQLSGVMAGDSLKIAAAMSKFQANVFAPAVAKMWCLLFPQSELPSGTHYGAGLTAGLLKNIDISLDFKGADILFSDTFMSHSGFRLTAPSMRLSCDVQGYELTTIQLLEGSDVFRIDAVVDGLSMPVVCSDGNMRFTLESSRYDLHCSIRTLSLYISDRLLDYAFPFLHKVLMPAVSMFNPQQIVDNLIEQHSGKSFSITTGAEFLRLYLGDSSPAHLFIPLFNVRPFARFLLSLLFSFSFRLRLPELILNCTSSTNPSTVLKHEKLALK